MIVGSVHGMVCVHRPTLGLGGLFFFLPFDHDCGRCFSFPIIFVSPLLSSFSSLPCLLSCLRAVVIPLFVIQCFDSIIPLFCFPDPVSYYAQFIAPSEWVLRPLALTLTPSPSLPSDVVLFFPPPRPRSQSCCILYIRV